MLSEILVALLFVAQPDAGEVEATQASATVADEGDDELICRRRVVETSRVGERMRTIRVCKTREEWEDDRRSRRAG